MKNSTLFLICFLICFVTTSVDAQVPHAISFQGIASDNQGAPVKDKTIGVEVKVIQGSPTGQEKYVEEHKVKTNQNGLYSLSIGLGNPSYSTFSEIDWADIPMFISINIDVNGGNDYQFIGANQLLSVPYALVSGVSYIKPKIYVVRSPIDKKDITIYNRNPNWINVSNIYFYRWIQGEPEDVFIEYQNLPSNIDIITNAMGGFGIKNNIVNGSGVDTIRGGLMKPNSFFKLSNSSADIVPDTYPIKMIFRTNNDILDSLSFNLIVKNYPIFDCFQSLPTERYLKSVACVDSSLQSVNLPFILEDTIVIKKYDYYRVSITDIIKDNRDELNTFKGSCENLRTDDYITFYKDENMLEFEQISIENNSLVYKFRLFNYVTDETSKCTFIYSE